MEKEKAQENPNDDNVSFKSTKSSPLKKMKRPTNILTFFIGILEVLAVIVMELQFNAICVQTMEVGPQVYVLLMCTYTFACPDLFMFVLMFVNDKIFFRPFVSFRSFVVILIENFLISGCFVSHNGFHISFDLVIGFVGDVDLLRRPVSILLINSWNFGFICWFDALCLHYFPSN